MPQGTKAVKTEVRPRVGKMKKIIHRAAKFNTLIHGYLAMEGYVPVDVESDGTCSLSGNKPCTSVGRCAMGELLFAIGYNNKDLEEMDAGGGWDNEVYQDLWNAYRIDSKDVSKIIGGNDKQSSNTVAQREAAVLKVLTKLDVKKPRINPFLTRLDVDGTVLGPLPTKKEVEVLKKFDVYHVYEGQNGGY